MNWGLAKKCDKDKLSLCFDMFRCVLEGRDVTECEITAIGRCTSGNKKSQNVRK